MAYLLDANVFIEAKNRHFRFDFCPAFWEWLLREHAAGVVFSVEKVEDELVGGVDELAIWASARGSSFFLRPDPAVMPALSKVSTWAASQKYEPAAVSTFLQAADYYLVGHALAHGHTIVGHEIPSTSRKRIKIPDACLGLGIKHMSPYELLSREQARFHLGPRPARRSGGPP